MDNEAHKIPKINKNKLGDVLKKIKVFDIKNSDVFLIGYMKSGTTWAQEMIWLIVNNLDYEGAKTFVDERVPILELSGYYGDDAAELEVPEFYWNSLEFVKNMKDPRCIKTHLTWELLPKEILQKTKKPKIIYIARNPKDVCLSSYHYLKTLLNRINCTFEEYCDFFLKGHIFADDRCVSYWKEVLHFWECRNDPNVLFIKYEDMKQNLPIVIRNVAQFLGKSMSDDDVSYLGKRLDFETMRKNAAVNHEGSYNKSGFMRAGTVGGHKDVMSDEIIKKFDSWIEENLRGTDYQL
ncbi:hypothetical protein FQR65_LT08615 [Abscondita terminalis]|nr:hypothetical protein FQR65_LT08615 [Abscondita terminalis]